MRTQYPDLIDTVAHAVIEPNNYELVRNLGRVLGIRDAQQVLLIAQIHTLQQALSDEFHCDVTLFDEDVQQLPFADDQFDSIIVARPLTTALLPITRELARVLKLHGTLGVLALSLHADYVSEAYGAEYVDRLGAVLRPAAAYRAVLAESGFTAFVSTPRKSDLLRSARETYRQYMLQPAAPVAQPTPEPTAQVLNLLATDGIAATLITAEKAL
jgi:ubiquinone/menaquinone biosynthesis C-methylase UbiE